jgi:hypothetical protein
MKTSENMAKQTTSKVKLRDERMRRANILSSIDELYPRGNQFRY